MRCLFENCDQDALPKGNFCGQHEWSVEVSAYWGDPEVPGADDDTMGFGEPEAAGDPEVPGAGDEDAEVPGVCE